MFSMLFISKLRNDYVVLTVIFYIFVDTIFALFEVS